MSSAHLRTFKKREKQWRILIFFINFRLLWIFFTYVSERLYMGIEFIGTQIFMSMTQVISSGGQEKIPSRKDTRVGSHENFLFVPPGLKPFSGLDRSRRFHWHPGRMLMEPGH